MIDLLFVIAGIFLVWFAWVMAREWRRSRILGRRYREATNQERAKLEDEIAKNPDLANYTRPLSPGAAWAAVGGLLASMAIGAAKWQGWM